MTKPEAIANARQIALDDDIDMVVCFNPHAEEPYEGLNYTYFPAFTKRLFPHEEIIQTFPARGNADEE